MLTYFKIIRYPAFQNFKRSVGKANHGLVTARIALDELAGKTPPPISDPTVWNPKGKDVTKSVADSAEAIRKTSLVEVADHTDELLKDFFKTFYPQNNQKFSLPKGEKAYGDVYRSLFNKFYVVREELLKKDYRNAPVQPLDLTLSLLDLAIQWRNNLVHHGADNPLLPDSKSVMVNCKSLLASNIYQLKNRPSLNIVETLERFAKKESPTFEEAIVLIRNMIDFGYVLNAYWFANINQEERIRAVLKQVLPMKACK